MSPMNPLGRRVPPRSARTFATIGIALILGAVVNVSAIAAVEWDWSRSVSALIANGDMAPHAADDTGVYYASPSSHIRKYSPNGVFLWDRALPVIGGGAEIGRMAADETGLYVGGAIFGHWPGQDPPAADEYHVYAARFTSDGDLVWGTQFPITQGEGFPFDAGVTLGPGAVYLGGAFITGEGFMARLNRDGTFRWQVDVAVNGEFVGIAADSDGAVMLDTGSDLHAYGPNGGHRWTRSGSEYWEVLAAPGGGTLVLEKVRASGTDRLRVRRYGPDGSVGPPHVVFGSEHLTPVGLASFGNRIFAGWFYQDGSVYRIGWAALDLGLALQWTRSHGVTSESDMPASLVVSSRGGYILGMGRLNKFAIDGRGPATKWGGFPPPEMLILPHEFVAGLAKWTGNDDLSGIDHYQLQQRENGGAWTPVKLDDPAVAAQLVNEKPAATYRFRVRGIDKSGNVGAWSTSPGYALSLFQENSQSITYDSNWKLAPDADSSGGAAMTASKAGAWAKFKFTGDAFGFATIIGPDIGRVAVFIDGTKVKTLNLNRQSETTRWVAFARSWGKVGAHQVKLLVEGTVGHPNIYIDAFEVSATQ